jgi:type I restriction enzyme M protein
VLAPSKEKVLQRQAELRARGLQDPDAQLRKVSGFAFYNTSRFDFGKLLADAPHLAANLRNYIAGFSPNMREVLEKFDFDNTIKLDEAGSCSRCSSASRTWTCIPTRSTTRPWAPSSRS